MTEALLFCIKKIKNADIFIILSLLIRSLDIQCK